MGRPIPYGNKVSSRGLKATTFVKYQANLLLTFFPTSLLGESNSQPPGGAYRWAVPANGLKATTFAKPEATFTVLHEWGPLASMLSIL